jgi:monovalent cation:H+ antiporter-2, CPA2 family
MDITPPLLAQILLLLGSAVAIILLFQRLNIPSVLGYLLVGVLIGPHTAGPILGGNQVVGVLAEFGIAFLLFTIGLGFSPAQIHALRYHVFGLGTAQVLLTTMLAAAGAWMLGLPAAAAFVVGAVFAQSSSTIIGRQLAEQGEADTRPGRLSMAMSVFQDVTSVPFVVVIPVLGAAAFSLAGSLGWALGKAVLAMLAVFVIGRWVLRPLFHLVASRRSAELFTMAVLFVLLTAGGATMSLGLSMAFGAFLAGVMLAETEYRHQVESAIRPFRDVLLGVFFVSIGMLFDPYSLPRIWLWALGGAVVLMGIKILLVAMTARWAGIDPQTAWRTGLVLAVGGEFGFALLAIGIGAGVIGEIPAQIVLTAVLFSMIAAPFLIRYNHRIAARITRTGVTPGDTGLHAAEALDRGGLRDHVIICGYGRIGQSVGHSLEEEGIPYIALDLDPARSGEARSAGEPVIYGDSSEPDILNAVGLDAARLVVISHDDIAAAHKTLQFVRSRRPDLPVMVRTRDEGPVDELRAAGATEVVPETVEAGMMIVSHALLLLKMPLSRVIERIRRQRAGRYRLFHEQFRSGIALFDDGSDPGRLRPVRVPPESRAVGRALGELGLDGVVITAMVRGGKRTLSPAASLRLKADDTLVLFGAPKDLERAERRLLR